MRFRDYIKAKWVARVANLQAESAADKASRRTAVATVWMAIFTFVLTMVNVGTLWILSKQLKEMHDGGVDTHKLAEAAVNQAAWTQRLATSSGNQVEQMKSQADQTKIIAKQALLQATTARQSFEAEARPYVGVRGVVYKRDDSTHTFDFGWLLQNSGRIPAQNFNVYWDVYEGTNPMPRQDKGGPAKSRFLNPGETSSYRAFITDRGYYSEIMANQMIVTIYIKYAYHWRNEVEEKCEKAQYDPVEDAFIALGADCPPMQ